MGIGVTEGVERSLVSLESMPTSDDEGCLTCKETRYVLDENQQARPCQCTRERRIHSRLPQRYWRARLNDFSPAVIEPALAWLLDPQDGLRISGPPGTGKTHLAAALVRHRCEQVQPAKFRQFSAIYRKLRECYSNNHSDRGELAELFDAPFLVLDDLGAGGLTDFERRVTLDILNERLNACQPTVVTSNWSL